MIVVLDVEALAPRRTPSSVKLPSVCEISIGTALWPAAPCDRPRRERPPPEPGGEHAAAQARAMSNHETNARLTPPPIPTTMGWLSVAPEPAQVQHPDLVGASPSIEKWPDSSVNVSRVVASSCASESAWGARLRPRRGLASPDRRRHCHSIVASGTSTKSRRNLAVHRRHLHVHRAVAIGLDADFGYSPTIGMHTVETTSVVGLNDLRKPRNLEPRASNRARRSRGRCRVRA